MKIVFWISFFSIPAIVYCVNWLFLKRLADIEGKLVTSAAAPDKALNRQPAGADILSRVNGYLFTVAAGTYTFMLYAMWKLWGTVVYNCQRPQSHVLWPIIVVFLLFVLSILVGGYIGSVKTRREIAIKNQSDRGNRVAHMKQTMYSFAAYLGIWVFAAATMGLLLAQECA